MHCPSALIVDQRPTEKLMVNRMFKTVLTATDGSAHSGRAVEVASDIAEKFGARLIVLHILAQGPLTESQTRMVDTEHLAQSAQAAAPSVADVPGRVKASSQSRAVVEQTWQVRRASGTEIVQQAERVAKSRGVLEITRKVHEGDPVKEILNEAEQEAVDLIVMGTRGLSDLRGLLLGSVSHKVCQLARCPCLTTKAEDQI